MKKAVLLLLPALAALLLTACNIGNAELKPTAPEDFEGIDGFSFRYTAAEDGGEARGYTLLYSGNWMTHIYDDGKYCVELATEKSYQVDDEEKKAWPAVLLQTPDPFAEFYTISDITQNEKIKWKKTGDETVNGVECEIYRGKAGLFDRSPVIIYKVRDKNIYIRLTGKNASGEATTDINLADLRLGGVTDADAGIPEGYTVVE